MLARMATSRAGRCACGAVTFTADADQVVLSAHCHCLDCQKATGSAFATVVGMPEAALDVHGADALRSWTVTGMSGEVTREFCATCGTPMFSASTGGPGIRFVKAGAFDDASWLEPAIECWTSREQPWARIPREIAGVPTNP
jgi:hypothetical protein